MFTLDAAAQTQEFRPERAWSIVDSCSSAEQLATEAPKAVLVSLCVPTPIGYGGNHRSYQILHDLAGIFGAGNVVPIPWLAWRESRAVRSNQGRQSVVQRSMSEARRIGRRIPPLRWAVEQWHRMTSSTWLRQVKLLMGLSSKPGIFSTPEFLRHYEEEISKIKGAAICIIEHPGFSGILPINQRLHIPTIACSQNIEALDAVASLQPEKGRRLALAALDFAAEFEVLARCDARLLISKVETGLVGGLGAPSHYYPYLPVGEIRHTMTAIRDRRAQGMIEPGLFLMVGTTIHNTTRQTFDRFLQQAMITGLPNGTRIVVCGLGTESLLPEGETIPGLELRGWLEQATLDDLLCAAQAVLVPHPVGFGVLTRLAELSSAGVPVITSQHPRYAMDLPPGITVVDDTWEAWENAMLESMRTERPLDAAEYDDWERSQANTLELVVRQVLQGTQVRA